MTRKESLSPWALEKVTLDSEGGEPCPYISLMACTPSLHQRCHALRRRSLRVTHRLRGAELSTASASKGRGQGNSSLGGDMSAATRGGGQNGTPAKLDMRAQKRAARACPHRVQGLPSPGGGLPVASERRSSRALRLSFMERYSVANSFPTQASSSGDTASIPRVALSPR